MNKLAIGCGGLVVILIFILILILGASARLYQLGTVPGGLNPDEASMGYDAFSLLQPADEQHTQPAVGRSRLTLRRAILDPQMTDKRFACRRAVIVAHFVEDALADGVNPSGRLNRSPRAECRGTPSRCRRPRL